MKLLWCHVSEKRRNTYVIFTQCNVNANILCERERISIMKSTLTLCQSVYYFYRLAVATEYKLHIHLMQLRGSGL